jgi:hypothetical protein
MRRLIRVAKTETAEVDRRLGINHGVVEGARRLGKSKTEAQVAPEAKSGSVCGKTRCAFQLTTKLVQPATTQWMMEGTLWLESR